MRTHQNETDISALSNAQLRELIALEDMSIIDPKFDDESLDLVGYSSTQFGHRYDG